MIPAAYPIGTPGFAWSDAERALWLARQTRRRSYAADVLGAHAFEVLVCQTGGDALAMLREAWQRMEHA